MLYEEKIINGVLMFRTTPGGKWQQCSIEKMSERIVAAEAKVAELEDDLLMEKMARNSAEKLCGELENERTEARFATTDALSRAVIAETKVRELEAGSEPFAVGYFDGDGNLLEWKSNLDCDAGLLPKGEPAFLYTTPQPVNVPEPQTYKGCTWDQERFVDGWNACREAMLSAQNN